MNIFGLDLEGETQGALLSETDGVQTAWFSIDHTVAFPSEILDEMFGSELAASLFIRDCRKCFKHLSTFGVNIEWYECT